jgi:hypothetical protein
MVADTSFPKFWFCLDALILSMAQSTDSCLFFHVKLVFRGKSGQLSLHLSHVSASPQATIVHQYAAKVLYACFPFHHTKY